MENQVILALKNNKLLNNILFDQLNFDSIKGQLITKSEGEILFRDSDDATSLFLVVSGEINLLKKKENQKTESSVIGENDFFGVDEFLQQGKRRSTAVVLRDSYIIALSKPEVDNLIEQNSGILSNLYASVGDDDTTASPVEETAAPPAADEQPAMTPDDGLSLEGLDDIEILEDPASETAAPAAEQPVGKAPEMPAENVVDEVKLDDIPLTDDASDISIDENLPENVLEITDDDINLDESASDDIDLPDLNLDEMTNSEKSIISDTEMPALHDDTEDLVKEADDGLELTWSEEKTGDGLELPDDLDDATTSEDSEDGLVLPDNLDDVTLSEVKEEDGLTLPDDLDDSTTPEVDSGVDLNVPENLEDDLTPPATQAEEPADVTIPEPEKKQEIISDITPDLASELDSIPDDDIPDPEAQVSFDAETPEQEIVPEPLPPAPAEQAPLEPAPVIRKTKFSGANSFELLEKINDAAQLVNSNIKIDDVLQNIVRVASDLTSADRGTLYLLEKEKNELWSKIAMGSEFKEIKLKVGNGIAGWVAEKGEILNLDNAQDDSRFNVQFDKTSGYVTKSMLCFPIKDKNSDIVGVLQLLNSKNGKFSNVDEELLEALSIHAAMALQNAELVEQLLKGERITSLGKMANFLIQDIKKPIMVSKRYTEHLKSKELPEESMKVIDLLLEQLDHIADLVNSTSNYSEGQIVSRSHLKKLNEVLDDFVKRIDSYVRSRNCSIVSDFEDDVDVQLSEKQLYQAFQHLVKNACDAMPEGGRLCPTAKKKVQVWVFQ
jgi:putative methionine-R-sulfoxide reductase with GAF domain